MTVWRPSARVKPKIRSLFWMLAQAMASWTHAPCSCQSDAHKSRILQVRARIQLLVKSPPTRPVSTSKTRSAWKSILLFIKTDHSWGWNNVCRRLPPPVARELFRYSAGLGRLSQYLGERYCGSLWNSTPPVVPLPLKGVNCRTNGY